MKDVSERFSKTVNGDLIRGQFTSVAVEVSMVHAPTELADLIKKDYKALLDKIEDYMATHDVDCRKP